MGKKRPIRIYHLVWPEDSEGLMAGVDLRMKGLSIRGLLGVQRLANQVADARESKSQVDSSVLEELFNVMGNSLIEWNIEEDDSEALVPATGEGLMSLDIDAVVEILTEWLEGMVGVAPPLSETSPAGELSGELSIPMEALSESLSS